MRKTETSSKISAMLPVHDRIEKTLETIERLESCVPPPAEILAHMTVSQVSMIQALKENFPNVRLIISDHNLGPGGGRNRMLKEAKNELVASFDDDSYPTCSNFFALLEAKFAELADASVIAMNIYEANLPVPDASGDDLPVRSFVGCGCAYRRSHFLETDGYVPIPIAYSMEEVDLALRLFERGRKIYFSPSLIIFHNTELEHHASAKVSGMQVANTALLVYLRYPLSCWPIGIGRVFHKWIDTVFRGRLLGACMAFPYIFKQIVTYHHYRAPVTKEAVRFSRRSKIASGPAIVAPPLSIEIDEPLTASIVITSKNRKNDLARAIDSSLKQRGEPEIIVIDDGSTDGTREMLHEKYPEVNSICHRESKGYIVRRNEAARIAKGDIIFSIDDDAEFSSENTVLHTLAEFNHQRIGAVAIPYVNVMQDDMVHQLGKAGEIYLTNTYIGTAHALRRDLFLYVGEYREEYIHQGEERDYCIRMQELGFHVRLGTAEPINHYESKVRSFKRMDYFGRRNDVLFQWNNVPFPAIGYRLPKVILSGILYGLAIGRPGEMFKGMIMGLFECMAGKHKRKPVSLRTFKINRLMRKRQNIILDMLDHKYGDGF